MGTRLKGFIVPVSPILMVRFVFWDTSTIFCHVTGHQKVKEKFDLARSCYRTGFCEDVGVFQEYIRLDKEFILEGRDGAYAGRLAILWEDDIC